MSQTETVANWIVDLKWEDLPAEVIEQAKRCLRDHLGCAAGGARSEPGRIAAKLALHWGGPGEATLMGGAEKVAARHAGFANATMANALDFDDTYHGHPGATVFPAALAAAEKWDVSGRDFLIAAIAGYEITIRAMSRLKPIIGRYRDMWDLGTLQAYGAGAAVARLAGLDANGVINVLGLLAGTAPVPLPRKQRYAGEGRSMLKSAYGWAVDAAIVAAELTQAGFSGPGHVFDDNLGFWEATDAPGFAGDLGQDWQIMRVEFKPYMACRFIHPVLQAVETIMERSGVEASAVQRVQIDAFSLLADEHHYILRPVSGTDAQFSVPFTVASMLTDGALSPATYEPTALHDQELLNLADQVQVNIDPDFDSAYPKRLGARVEIFLKDGSSDTCMIEHPKGSADQSFSDDELMRKFHALVDPLIGQTQARAANQTLATLEQHGSLTSLTRLFTPESLPKGS